MADNACYHSPLRPGGLKLTQELLDLGGVRTARHALDIGCGFGDSVAFVKEMTGADAIGIDIAPERIEQARAKHPGCNFLCASAYSMPFDDSSFDVVLAECSLSLFDDPAAAVAEIARVIKPQGLLLMSDVYMRTDAGASSSVGRRHADEASSPCTVRHARTLAAYTALLESGGFSVLQHEDRSRDLTQMFAQMIFDVGLDRALSDAGIDKQSASNIGYLAIVAAKDASHPNG